MPTYTVYMVTTASHAVRVEAEDRDEAIELAFEQSMPYFPGGMDGDLGEWMLPSEFDPKNNPEEDDVNEEED